MKNVKKLILGMATMFICMLFAVPPTSVRADIGIINNNFKQTLILPAKGADPEQESFYFQIKGIPANAKKATIKSSKKNVATAQKYEKLNYVFHVVPKKAGTTKITITATVGKKKVTRKGTIKVVKFANPFKTLKIDGKDYASAMKQNYTETCVTLSGASAKLSFKLKSGWKMKFVSYTATNASFDDNYVKKFKSGKTIKRGNYIMTLQNTKTKAMETFFLTLSE